MKTGIVKRILGTVTAAAMCLTALPSITASAANVGDKLSVGNGNPNQHRGNCDGYSYEVWLDNTGGNGSMTLGKGATFKAEWNATCAQGNYLARRGLSFDSSKKATDYPYIGMDYEASYKHTSQGGNSRLCVYGWFQNKGVGGNVPLVEYYIIEDWQNWCPGPNGSSKTVTIDGAQYEIFQIPHTGPTINGGSETFTQYFSIRKSKRTSGHITVSDHFKAWAEQGWGIGNLYEVALNAEGWESSGYADVTKLNVYTDPSQAGQDVTTPITTTTPVKPVDPDTNGYYFNSGFESGAGDWEGRGDAKVSIDSNNHNGGSKSLFVSGRTDNWHGAQMALDTAAFVPGNTYSFGAAVMQNKDSSTDLKLTLQYKDASGTAQYDEVAIATASKGKWTALSNTAYTIPSGASDLLLYVEAPDSLTDFYVDDIFGATKGKTFTVSGGTTTTDPTDDPTTPDNPPVSDGTGLKGIFAPWFKMGTSVSPNELYSGKDFLVANYNSITPENELKPDAILDQAACQQKGNNVNTQISLSRAANTLKFCEDNGISMRGHTFVWYSQTPDWFFRENFSNNGAYVSKDIMNQRLESMIKNTFAAIKQQYPKLDLYAYDICNELFLNDGGGLRNAYETPNNGASNWIKVYGEGNDEFIINAFKYARQYAPEGCKLYINDYNEYIPAKTQDIYDIAMKLKGLGYIDGIGMQSHLDTSYPSASVYKTALEKFLSTGLEVQITELDITCSDFSAQANLYEEIFKLAMAHADQIPALTIWGTTDNVSWRSGQNPLLFSQGYKAKPAYDKVVALAKSTNPPATTTTTTSKPVTTTTTTSNNPAVEASLWGDANCDKEVNLADAVAILQSIANPDKFKLSEQGAANADVNENGNGISSLDALAIQKYLLHSITKLPESYSTAAITTVAATVVTTTVTEAADKEFFNNSFENGAGSWEARGNVTLASSSDSYYSGSKSLKVSGRSDTWNGAAVALSTSEFKPGSTYSFSAAVMQTSGSKQAVNMTLEYKDASGETNYATVAEASAANTEWTKLENTAYTIPSGASDMLLYIELPDSASANIYIDDVVAASKGTKSKVVTGSGVVGSAAKAEAEAPVSTVDPTKPMIAISFDDGASPATGTRIVDALAKEGFTATFFYVANWIRDTSGENEVKYAYSKGMEIANHSTSHPDLSTKSSSEIRSEYDQCEAKLKKIIGAQPSKLLRLPYLGCNSTVQQTLYDAPLITCAIDTQDWNGASKDQIVNTIKQAIQSGNGNGAIVLCHETYETTAAAMEELAPWIKAQGWQVVSISEMFAAKGKTLNGGQVYTKCN